MAAHLIDSRIFHTIFGTDRMRAIFSDETTVQRWLDVEAALARVQARLGLIPESAAAEITRRATCSSIDLDDLRRETERVGYPILPLVQQLARACEGDAGQYVHWGATTQDVMDTAVVLQIRDAIAAIEDDLDSLQHVLVDLAQRYRTVPMAGRTHGQQALPITFGYKMAIWLAEVHRHVARLREMRGRVLVGQFGGAAGTLASLGDRGLAVQAALMEELGLGQPIVTWHVARDGFAEITALLGLLTATLGKVANEIALLMTTEVAEVSEPFVDGRGSSSTMPQKRNPISCEVVIAIAKIVRQHVPLALDAMGQEHERGTGPWQVEWEFLPECFVLTSAALQQTSQILAGLQVDTARMRENLELTRGLIVSEAVMMRLAPHLGRQRAHDLVYRACLQAASGRTTLLDVLRTIHEIHAYISDEELQRLLDPTRYTGLAERFVDRVVEMIRGADCGSTVKPLGEHGAGPNL